MKMKLLRDVKGVGVSGGELSGPSAWRLAFPIKGCIAKAADAEARAAIERELSVIDAGTRARVSGAMADAGTLPVDEPEPTKPVAAEAPKAATAPAKPFVPEPTKEQPVTKK